MFSGGGGVEAGMVMAGIRPVNAIEFDPTKPKLSAQLGEMHSANFGEYGCQLVQKSVQELARLSFPGILRDPDFLHASPVCSNFSQMKIGGVETSSDIEMAEAVAKAIHVLSPKIFTLEQVCKYESSTSWNIIASKLKKDGYKINLCHVSMADYGVPQKKRDRMIVVACRNRILSIPSPINKISWWDAVSDLVSFLPPSTLVPGQQKSLSEYLSQNEPCFLLIQRTGARGEYRVQPWNSQACTLLRSIFSDGKGANRNQFLDIWFPGGEVKRVTIAAAARLQTFPNWYKFSEQTSVSGSAIGYAVPPLFAKQLFEFLLLQVNK